MQRKKLKKLIWGKTIFHRNELDINFDCNLELLRIQITLKRK